jgi:hypothetical protein
MSTDTTSTDTTSTDTITTSTSAGILSPDPAGVSVGSGRVARLAADAADAARVRALTTYPDVIALRVEKVRAQVDALLWAGIVLGLAFTMVNVQAFAAVRALAVRVAGAATTGVAA